MCGHNFDPAGHHACAACPLQPGCQLVCCPQCGYELVDINKSRLVQIASRLFLRKRHLDEKTSFGLSDRAGYDRVELSRRTKEHLG
jgi:hypothetical protein